MDLLKVNGIFNGRYRFNTLYGIGNICSVLLPVKTISMAEAFEMKDQRVGI